MAFLAGPCEFSVVAHRKGPTAPWPYCPQMPYPSRLMDNVFTDGPATNVTACRAARGIPDIARKVDQSYVDILL